MGFVSNTQNGITCNSVQINVKEDKFSRFVSNAEIVSKLSNIKNQKLGTPLNEINTDLIEQAVNKHPGVRRSLVYKTIDGKVHVKVEQRRPLIRIITQRMENFFIDDQGGVIPYNGGFSAHTLIANGYIDEPIRLFANKMTLTVDSFRKRAPVTAQLYELAEYLKSNPFWDAQIQQVYVNTKSELILIPRVGSHTIVLGNTENLNKKFERLKKMYRIFNQIGWNQYKTINLKYKNQVVCTKRI